MYVHSRPKVIEQTYRITVQGVLLRSREIWEFYNTNILKQNHPIIS